MSMCIHCSQTAVAEFFADEPFKKIGPFCCQGCMSVYNVISTMGLSEYYDIKKTAAMLRERAPVENNKFTYDYLDDLEFQKEYSYQSSRSLTTMEFYLEGIHCLACLWIIEKLPSFVQHVHSAKLDMGKSVVTVTLDNEGSFSEVARELESIGYRPHALKYNQESNELKNRENRSMLLRIGVAGAAAGNIMLFAVSLYAGAEREYGNLFNALTVIFALPALTYSAFPFYKNSYHSIKNKTLSIDVPISLALIMGGLMGLYNLVIGIHENYFDSLTALVFLLLLSRYFLKIIQEKGLSATDLHFFYQGENVLKQIGDSSAFKVTHPRFIKKGEILKILPNQIMPADAQIISGHSYLNNSLLTGESQLQKVSPGDNIYSGTMNISNEIIVKVVAVNKETRLGNILRSIENGWGQKSKIVGITNLISRYFVAAVFALSIILFLREMINGNTRHALEQALTLLIVTCPCALAIATPLTFIRTLSKSAARGIVIKDDSVIEKLSKAKNIFIDKTGTLTQNTLHIKHIKHHSASLINLDSIIYHLESNSSHPVAKGLVSTVNINQIKPYDLEDFKEIPGEGVSARINGHLYEIRDYSIYEDSILIADFEVRDTIISDAEDCLLQLSSLGLNFTILSGDKKKYVEELAQKLNLKSVQYSYELSPEDKSQIIRQSSNTVMIGDGANDSVALSFADTGIAVYGALDISLRAADVYLSVPGLKSAIDLLIISRETMKIIYRNLVLSLFYNSISVALAFAGQISPLTAAIIMPLSSLTVLISTLIGTKKLRQQWKS